MLTADTVRFIIVHCSRTKPEEGDGFYIVDRKCRLRGCFSCGYHYVVGREGQVEEGRPLTEYGNHTYGFNKQSLGVCLVGMPGEYTKEQRASLKALLEDLLKQYPHAKAVTHEELQPRFADGCPGIRL